MLCSHLTSASCDNVNVTININIASMLTQTQAQMQRMGVNVCVAIDAINTIQNLFSNDTRIAYQISTVV